MTAVEPTRLGWRDRTVPIPAAAVVAEGASVSALVRSADIRIKAGARLSAAAGRGYLIVVGEEADLPWADGATYLGWDSTLLVPTTIEPVPRTALIAPAARRTAGAHDIVALLPHVVLHTESPRPIADGTRLVDVIAP